MLSYLAHPNGLVGIDLQTLSSIFSSFNSDKQVQPHGAVRDVVAEFTIFYSWQSDLPLKLSRDVIHGASNNTIERLRLNATVEAHLGLTTHKEHRWCSGDRRDHLQEDRSVRRIFGGP